MIKTNINFLMLFVFMLFFLASCSNSSEKVKRTEPDKENSQSVIGTPVDLARSLYSDKTNDEFVNTSFNHINRYIYIAEACGYYQYSHGILPQKLSDLLDGYILAWPRCVYTNQVIKEIDTMPDPENPEHIGKVYYERIDDFSGNICYLGIDVSSFIEGNPKWGVAKQEIIFLITNVSPDEKSRRGASPPADMPSEKRQNIAYRMHLFSLFRCMLTGQIERTGTIGNSFDSLFYDNGFCLFRNGIENLRKEIESGNADFELGHCSGTDRDIYYSSGTIAAPASILETGVLENSGPIGIEPIPSDNASEGHLYATRIMPILPDICKPVIHFSSSQFNSYTLRDEILIDREDVL